MAGVNVASGGGGRRSLDAEINAVPMVDLMMVTISFLLITAVWTHMSRMDATANAPNPDTTPVQPDAPRKVLEVNAKDDRFVLTWKRGAETLDSVDVEMDRPSGDKARGRFPTLAAKVGELWKVGGEHRDPADTSFDRAIVRVHDRMAYGDIVDVMDAVQQTRRTVTRVGRANDAPAFELVLGR